jgi:hypothetical protein
MFCFISISYYPRWIVNALFGGPLPAPTWRNYRWYNRNVSALRLKHIDTEVTSKFPMILRICFSPATSQRLNESFDSKTGGWELQLPHIAWNFSVGRCLRPWTTAIEISRPFKAVRKKTVKSTEVSVWHFSAILTEIAPPPPEPQLATLCSNLRYPYG